ncbi:MAG: 2-C-methyl-D-erythritol 2,4-cyclodiphosphate synthase [Chloroflexi bacterium]|jgi:2-C-methyl-D-erythritol 2,4-cyclodiphosphate synthase|nr:2-C-methyl-D-erythritol 2,4-cyclodiphosphate synthase [Chloroflexota bacterium]
MRTGIGYDIHPFEQGRPLVLGGVTIPHEAGLAGHSDADVLAHALIDALLGAAALGDIGRHFPPDDPSYRDANSLDLLRRAVELVAKAGYRAVNVDATVIAEAPKLSPHIDAMRAALAGALGLDVGAVSVKATSSERLGPVGRGEGIAALAVALLDSI